MDERTLAFLRQLSVLGPGPWPALTRLASAGFDVFGAASVGDYNRTLEPHLQDYALPELAGPSSCAVVIGNTRRLWPTFLDAYAQLPLAAETHPLDTYSRLHITAAATELSAALGVAHVLRFSFDPAPNTLAISRLAVLTGAVEASPVGLCVHPEHGPWLSLRAGLVLALPAPQPTAAAVTCSACSARPCVAARERVLAATGGGPFTRESFDEHWELWLAMRDACPVGRSARYSDRQIRYHYTKRLAVLRERD